MSTGQFQRYVERSDRKQDQGVGNEKHAPGSCDVLNKDHKGTKDGEGISSQKYMKGHSRRNTGACSCYALTDQHAVLKTRAGTRPECSLTW